MVHFRHYRWVTIITVTQTHGQRMKTAVKWTKRHTYKLQCAAWRRQRTVDTQPTAATILTTFHNGKAMNDIHICGWIRCCCYRLLSMSFAVEASLQLWIFTLIYANELIRTGIYYLLQFVIMINTYTEWRPASERESPIPFHGYSKRIDYNARTPMILHVTVGSQRWMNRMAETKNLNENKFSSKNVDTVWCETAVATNK